MRFVNHYDATATQLNIQNQFRAHIKHNNTHNIRSGIHGQQKTTNAENVFISIHHNVVMRGYVYCLEFCVEWFYRYGYVSWFILL